MLVNRNKTKNVTKKHEEKIGSNIQSMRSWIRKIEQSTNSVSSRLSAVEKRITNKSNGESRNGLSGLTIIDGSLDNLVTKLNDGNEEKNLEYVFRVLDSEMAMITDDVENLESDIESLKNNISQINSSIDETNDELIKTRDSNAKNIVNMKDRLEDLERKAPPSMRIGNLEIPIEISGITAGSVALFAAIMVSIDKSEIITSPAFLAFAGLLFIGAAIFKTLKSRKPAISK